MKLNTHSITWKGTTGTTEASDLGLPVGSFPFGLILESHRTGRRMLFYRTTVTRDDEGDILSTSYRALHQGKNIVLTVFND